MYRLPLSPSVKSGEGVDAPSPIFTEGRGSVHRLGREMSAVFSRWNKKVESVGSVLTFPLLSNSLFDKSKSPFLGVSLCCGNHCWFAFVLWYFYCSMSFQPVALRGLVIAPCRQHHETSPFHEWHLEVLRTTNKAILFLQPCDKEAMLGVKTIGFFLEEFT